MPALPEGFEAAVYAVTRMIPPGQVATYAQVATYVISPRHARAVGRALKHLTPALEPTVPWHRVINAGGRISLRGEVERPVEQARRLEAEGVVFDATGKTELRHFGWPGPPPGWRPPFADPDPGRRTLVVGPRS